MKQILIQDYLSVDICNKNPTHLYVFGDNMMRMGRKGQAAIRYCNNSFGVVTKNKPGWNESDFFSDKDSELRAMKHDLNQLRDIYYSTYNRFTHIIFPKGGLGTGLAKLPTNSPVIFNELCLYLKLVWDLDMNESGFYNDNQV
jgi:hypothetical protein